MKVRGLASRKEALVFMVEIHGADLLVLEWQ
jgi:hypothetical protein